MVKQNDVVGYKNTGHFREVVLEDVLKMFAKKMRMQLIKLPAYSRSQINKIDNKEKISKVAIGQTIDLTAYKIINVLINNSAKNLDDVQPIEGKIIKPLYLFLDKEVLLYAKIKKLKFEKVEEKKNEISKFVDELEIKHPEIKRAVVNGWLEIN